MKSALSLLSSGKKCLIETVGCTRLQASLVASLPLCQIVNPAIMVCYSFIRSTTCSGTKIFNLHLKKVGVAYEDETRALDAPL